MEEEDEEERAEVREGPAPLMEELYGLQLLCRALQNREERVSDTQDSNDVEYISPLKNTAQNVTLHSKRNDLAKATANHRKTFIDSRGIGPSQKLLPSAT